MFLNPTDSNAKTTKEKGRIQLKTVQRDEEVMVIAKGYEKGWNGWFDILITSVNPQIL